MATLPGLQPDSRPFEVGDVVRLDRVAYNRLSRGDSALAEMAAKQLPQIVGQVSQVRGPVVEVIWENGRMVPYTRDSRVPWYTTTEVLIDES